MKIQKNASPLFILIFFLLFTVTNPAFPQIYNQKPTSEKFTPDANSKAKTINKISKLLEKNYIFLETAKKMSEFMKTRLNNNGYDSITDGAQFAQILTNDLQSISKDKHLRVRFNPEFAARLKEMEKKGEDPEDAKEFVERMKYENYAFRKVERLEGNIGYIDFRNFAPSKYSKETVAAAMTFVSNCDAVIIDMRNNGGGDPDGVRLVCSYFFDSKPVHLNDLYFRAEDETDEFWTLRKVDGIRMPDVDLYVLTSGFTFSGAEEFTYNLKNLKRATIVGEVTGGGANPGGPVRINSEFVVFIPIGRAINPITKTNWEGTGVTPDVLVPQDKALETAEKLALEKMLKNTSDPQKIQQINWQIEGLNAVLNPFIMDENTLKTFAGNYEDRTVTLENGKLYYRRAGKQKYEMKPMAENMFRIEDLPYFRIKFNRDSDGKITEFIGLYDDGHSDKSMRTK
jgi:C-terminal processing protease CtpA/Prc